MTHPVITAIILKNDSEQEYEKLVMAIRNLAKDQIGDDWTFLDTHPVKIFIGDVKILTSLHKAQE